MGDGSRRDALVAAWDAAEAGEAVQPSVAGDDLEREAGAADDGVAESGVAADERFPEQDDDAGQPQGEADKPEAAARAGEEEEPGDQRDEQDEAPKNLSPEAREAWKDVPKAVKDAFAKREQEFSDGIAKYATAAQQGMQIQRSLAPFQQFFAINGGNPPKVVGDVLATAATLQMGAPQQRAQAAANLIKQFGVDINILDALLAGEAPPQQQPQQYQNDPALVRRLDELQNRFEQRDQQSINDELTRFANDPENEFYMDVRDDMADLLDMAANRGVQMSLKDAYKRACRMNESVARVLEARKARPDQQRRRQAASSVRGAPAGTEPMRKPETRRDAIRSAWEMHANDGRM